MSRRSRCLCCESLDATTRPAPADEAVENVETVHAYDHGAVAAKFQFTVEVAKTLLFQTRSRDARLQYYSTFTVYIAGDDARDSRPATSIAWRELWRGSSQ